MNTCFVRKSNKNCYFLLQIRNPLVLLGRAFSMCFSQHFNKGRRANKPPRQPNSEFCSYLILYPVKKGRNPLSTNLTKESFLKIIKSHLIFGFFDYRFSVDYPAIYHLWSLNIIKYTILCNILIGICNTYVPCVGLKESLEREGGVLFVPSYKCW